MCDAPAPRHPLALAPAVKPPRTPRPNLAQEIARPLVAPPHSKKGRTMKRLGFASMLLVVGTMAWAATQGWTGHWQFDECWPHLSGQMHDCISYRMDIRETGSGYTVDIDLDGFQTMKRLSGDGRFNRDALEILFRATRPDDMGSDYKPGDILLILKKQNGKVLTEWHGIEPELQEHQKPGFYFRKTIDGSGQHRR